MISVIIPSYNANRTIKRAIDSVLNQTFKDFEIVLVDDGSTDNTKEIVEGINNQRIHYFYKENGGIADARNYGVAKANGDYIAFLDSDDYYDSDYLMTLYKAIGESDVAVCDYRYVYADNTVKEIKCASFKRSNLVDNKRLLIDIMPQPWNKLIKKEVFTNTSLKFPKGLVFEDLCFFSSVMPEIKSIVKVDKSLINYYQLDSSIMASAKQIKKTIYDFDEIVKIIDDHYLKFYKEQYSEELEGLFSLNARELVDGIVNNKVTPIDERTKAIASILNTLNSRYPNWFNNKYYKEKYVSFGKIFLLKRKIIDYLLSRNRIEFVMKRILCRGEQ